MAALSFHLKNLAVGIAGLAVTEAGRELYRPWVYSQGIDDWGVADTLGNSFGTLTAVFVIVGLVGKDASSDYRLIALIAGGLAVYELLQGPMGGAIDPRDIVASLVTGVVCALIYRALNRHPVTFTSDRRHK
jgi:hypothetical protein